MPVAAATVLTGTVTVTVVGVGPHTVQTETVVVQPDREPETAVGDVGSDEEVMAGRVRVTVVGVAAQCVQTVTVVVHPSGISTVVVEAWEAEAPVTLAGAMAVSAPGEPATPGIVAGAVAVAAAAAAAVTGQ